LSKEFLLYYHYLHESSVSSDFSSFILIRLSASAPTKIQQYNTNVINADKITHTIPVISHILIAAAPPYLLQYIYILAIYGKYDSTDILPCSCLNKKEPKKLLKYLLHLKKSGHHAILIIKKEQPPTRG